MGTSHVVFFTPNCCAERAINYSSAKRNSCLCTTRSSYQKLNVPHRQTNVGQKALFYVGPSLWKNLNKTLKPSTSLNAFKHNIKQQHFNELKKKES